MHVVLDHPDCLHPVDPSRFEVRGWVWLEGIHPLLSRVEAWCGGVLTGHTETLHVRSDVNVALGLAVDAKVGFDFFVRFPPGSSVREFDLEIRISLLNGSQLGPFCQTRVQVAHVVSSVALEGIAGDSRLAAGQNSLQLAGPIRVHLDSPDSINRLIQQRFEVRGWVWHENAHSSVAAVEAWNGETMLGQTDAFYIRPDVGEALALATDAKTGFDFVAQVPESWTDKELTFFIQIKLADGSRIGPFCQRRILVLPVDVAGVQGRDREATASGPAFDELGALKQRVAELERENAALKLLVAQRNDPAPPDHLQKRQTGAVAGPLFFQEGRRITDQIISAFSDAGHPLSKSRAILDFGCGCGRVMKGLKDLSLGGELWGCDIDFEAIKWNRIHLGDIAQFCSNPHLPPTQFHDGYFDAVYSVSVFTHLPEEMQFAWLTELRRITAPNAICVASVHGAHYWESIHPNVKSQVEASGFDYRSAAKTEGLPDFYMVAFHSEEYIRTRWSRFFEILAIRRRFIGEAHDAVVMRRRGD